MIEHKHKVASIAVSLILLAVILVLALFNVYLAKRIDEVQRRCDESAILDNSFKILIKGINKNIDAMRADLDKTMDLKFSLKNKPFRVRRVVPVSWYASKIMVNGNLVGDNFCGAITASGEVMTDTERTCATKDQTIPFGTIIFLYLIETGKVAFCRVNDRAPSYATVELDMSRPVAEDLDILYRGGGTAILFY